MCYIYTLRVTQSNTLSAGGKIIFRVIEKISIWGKFNVMFENQLGNYNRRRHYLINLAMRLKSDQLWF